MVVIETKIPIVAVQQRYHTLTHQQSSSSVNVRSCTSRYWDDICCYFWNGPMSIREIQLYDRNDDDNVESLGKHRITSMPEQLLEFMTPDMYLEFGNKINEWIRKHDIAAQNRYRYDELYLKKMFQAATMAMLFAVLAMVGISLFLSKSDGTVILLCVFQFAFIILVSLKVLYRRKFNRTIVQNISIQNDALAQIQRECDKLSKDISTSSVVTTFYVAYSQEGDKYHRYCDCDSRTMLKTTKFDHIIVTSTTLAGITTTMAPMECATTTTTDVTTTKPLPVADVDVNDNIIQQKLPAVV